MIRVFVYGTLKPGEINYRLLCEGKINRAIPAIAHGNLYALPAGYPAVTPGTGEVHGYVLEFGSLALLAELDALEDYEPQRPAEANDYNRIKIEVMDENRQSLGLVWFYQMSSERVEAMGGIQIKDGIWRSPQPPSI
ncbi:gamma-glutamylcyclotransferase family protein [Vacuolonema iberomarrocanum]|uniref:gamma-glutamylcyclotransferase family protein n=1 Tax=Vacuolonema iberomarrocanum TaxID=3454632 RepID=UPI0019DB9878|nr:gamma-glutamylcyclotransferase [filamentous cyanobacterium LEGE 07170]